MRGNRSFIVLSSRSTRQVIISETCRLSSAGISIVQSPFVSTSGGFVRRFARTRRLFRRSFLARLFLLLHFGLRLGGRAIVFEQQHFPGVKQCHKPVYIRSEIFFCKRKIFSKVSRSRAMSDMLAYQFPVRLVRLATSERRSTGSTGLGTCDS